MTILVVLGKLGPMSKMTKEQVIAYKKLRVQGLSRKVARERLGLDVSRQALAKVDKGLSHSDIKSPGGVEGVREQLADARALVASLESQLRRYGAEEEEEFAKPPPAKPNNYPSTHPAYKEPERLPPGTTRLPSGLTINKPPVRSHGAANIVYDNDEGMGDFSLVSGREKEEPSVYPPADDWDF